MAGSLRGYAQTDQTEVQVDSIPKPVVQAYDGQYDVGDMFRDIFTPGKKKSGPRRPSAITPMPSLAYNPTIGAQVGIKAVAGKVLGNEPGTLISVAATSASITTKGIMYFYLSHNVYTSGNNWNLQGSLIAARTVSPDFGLGIGHAAGSSAEDLVLSNPNRQGFIQRGIFYSFREKIYKQVADAVFLGAGVSFDIRRNIRPGAFDGLTPYQVYNERYGYDPVRHQANGFFFNVQYTTRDHQNQPYHGIYSDVGMRVNQTWMGSTKSAVQLTTDFRKYWSLSERNPHHVLAFWHWGSYLLNGSVPYMDLAGSGRDASARSARGYISGYFRAPMFFYSESEYRFPILRNRFLSGAAFMHVQSASDLVDKKLFRQWQPGGGVGLRMLFNKATRTNLCIDYAFGAYGMRGLFLGLNEAF